MKILSNPITQIYSIKPQILYGTQITTIPTLYNPITDQPIQT